MNIVIFLGPTIGHAEARARLHAHYLPPCAAGDVFNAVEHWRPSAIGIIDGFFEVTPSVWHKEILYALSQGVAVFGASSMGALRAAELHPFGMRGVGSIFADYASGAYEDDDEVAVSHADEEHGYRPLSVPMVDIRHGLLMAVESGIVSATMATSCIAAIKALHYPHRSWDALWQAAMNTGMSHTCLETLQTFIRHRAPALKRDDGLKLLDEIAHWKENGAPAPAMKEVLEPTIFWEHLISTYGSRPASRDGAAVSRERLLNHVKLTSPDRQALRRQALLRHLIDREAKTLRIAEGDDRAILARFRRDHGLTSAADFKAWLQLHDIGNGECLDIARAEARERVLTIHYGAQTDLHLPAMLKQAGTYQSAQRETAAKWQAMADSGITIPSAPDVSSLDDVLAWYQTKFGRVTTGLEDHATELGFGSLAQFASELVAAFLASETRHQETSHAIAL